MNAIFNKYTAGNRRLMIAPTLWAFIENLTTMVPAILGMLAIGTLVSAFMPPYSVDVALLWTYCACMAAAMLVQGVISLLSYRNSYYASQRAMATMRRNMVRKMMRLPLGTLNAKESGEFANTFVTDPDNLDQSISFFLPQVVSMSLLTVLSAAMLFVYDWRLALPMYIMLPICLLLMRVAMKLRYRQAERVSKVRVTATTLLNEYTLGMKVLKSYNQTGSGFSRLRDVYQKLSKETTKEEGVPGALTLLAAHIINFGIPLIIFAGSTLLMAGTVDLFMLLAFLILSTRLYSPLSTAVTCIINLRAASVSADRINHLMAAGEQQGTSKQVSVADITFQDVSFSYNKEDGKPPVIRHATFTAEKNRLTALVGPSGSGKSTILRLISRFWDVDDGAVLLGDTDIRGVQPHALYAQISMVFQDNYLFGDTIRNNILFGRAGKSDDEMIAAAKKACCHTFITQLPDGYNTLIGEGGATLSGGERQRIAIARAILKDAPILLLDEPTSNLDAESEAAIQSAIDALVREKTVVMIAHRLKTIAAADRIVVLDEGRVVQNGTHDELLQNKNGLYHHLWSLQHNAQGWNIQNNEGVEL